MSVGSGDGYPPLIEVSAQRQRGMTRVHMRFSAFLIGDSAVERGG